MKNKISIIILMLIASISFSQLNISTDYREDLIWNDNTEDWEEFSSENSITFFEFEDTVQSKMGMFIHRTDDITSAYLIKSHKYSEEYDWDEFDIVSDLGNKYTLYVKIGDEELDGYLWFTYKNKEGVYQAVKHRIKSIWVTEDETEESEEHNETVDLYNGDFSFKEYFIERGELDPIEGIWSLNVERTIYYYDSVLHTEFEEMRSEWAIAYHDETSFKVYGLEEESDFEAFFEKTSIDGFYNYTCDFTSPNWRAKSNVTLEDGSILKYGYYVDENYIDQFLGDKYIDGMRYHWDFTWIKKYPLNSKSSSSDGSGCVSGDCENGYGVYKFSDDWEGDVYKGNFKDGKRHGYGIYSWSEGSKYEGNWSNGYQHGEGKYTFADGEETEGEWSNGEFIDETSENSWIGGGTGFFIDRKGYFATNYHVVEDATYIEIEFYRDGELQNHKAEVIKTDKNNDLAILKISDEDFERFDEIPYYFSTRVADIGEEVFALGYPLTNYMGKDIKFTDGKISSKTGYDGDIANYQTTTPIQPGNSGGPLFDYEGNLIAINAARFTYENSQNVSYSIKSTYLKNLIDVLPVNLRLPHNKNIRDLKLTEKIKVISDYVVLIRIK